MQINVHQILPRMSHCASDKLYNIALGKQIHSIGSMMDRGANGGFAGADCRLLAHHSPMQYADVTGIGEKKYVISLLEPMLVWWSLTRVLSF